MSARPMTTRRRRPAPCLALGLMLGLSLGLSLGSAGTAHAADDLAQALAHGFRSEGQATVERLRQDRTQAACSQATPPDDAARAAIEAENLATVRYPDDGRWIGDWRRGEAIAQSGRGATWTDPAGVPGGGSCYNCHQLGKQEIAYGTLGPSLADYGRRRGQGEAVLRYTWAKLWNAKAFQACSAMPRFGHAGLLDAAQIRDLMGLLFDPASPVNR